MKNKKIMAIVIIMMMASNSFVYAGQASKHMVQNESQQESLVKLYQKAGLDQPEIIMNTLASLGISDQDLKEAISQGTKVFELLQEKEIALGEFKQALAGEYETRIKQARKDKVITLREARTLTKLLKERMDAWEV